MSRGVNSVEHRELETMQMRISIYGEHASSLYIGSSFSYFIHRYSQGKSILQHPQADTISRQASSAGAPRLQ